MPWCDDCSKYLTPNSVQADGTCPRCSTEVATVERSDADDRSVATHDESSPWHFKLMVGMVTLYLGWRVVQLFA